MREDVVMRELCEDIALDDAGYVGEVEAAADVAEGELLVVYAHEAEERCVEVVNVANVLGLFQYTNWKAEP